MPIIASVFIKFYPIKYFFGDNDEALIKSLHFYGFFNLMPSCKMWWRTMFYVRQYAAPVLLSCNARNPKIR